MKEKVFTDSLGRKILIKVSDEHISFYFVSEIERHKEWLRIQEEQDNEVSEDEKTVDDFYWIDKQHWIDDYTQRQDRTDNFHYHMKRKSWFTNEIYIFMNKSSGL